MESAIITITAALITGVCAIIASIIAKSNKKKKEEKEIIEVHVKPDKYTELFIPSTPNHPVFLNPDDYDIDAENYIVTLAGLLQQSRSPKDVSVRKIDKSKVGETKK